MFSKTKLHTLALRQERGPFLGILAPSTCRQRLPYPRQDGGRGLGNLVWRGSPPSQLLTGLGCLEE